MTLAQEGDKCGKAISFFQQWANPGLFLFIFILFNKNFTEKLWTLAGL